MSSDSSHDSGYKLLFSHAQVVEDLLRGFVPEDWVAELDFTTLEKVSGSYVSDDLRDREDDIIWRVRRQGQWLYVYVLLEFQSSVDPWMALRVMVYTGLLYQDLIKTGEVRRGQKLPPVFPLVLYNGRQRWNAARDVSELIDLLPGSLKRYHPAHRYFLLDESAVGEEHLSDRQNTVTSIIRLETSAVPADVRQAVSQLQQRLQGPQYASLRRAFVVWINRIVLRRLMPGQEVPEVNELQEIDTMLAETVEEWTRQWKADGLQQGLLQGLQEGRQKGRQEGRQEGLQEGRQEGLEQGLLRGERMLLHKQLERRYGALPTWVSERLAQADHAQLEAWALDLLDAANLEDIFPAG
ncbi:MAG: Rpn family recombination-promoting nuclease/putative transposase [Candidatus Accumulibacter propinquus]|uniref:Rpn family recombination-promoting nuclease/putative transposase n=1 Tax=Candidatus Accumulibacter propinquus TaxID=2954380 RepID=UPI002FC2E7F4